MSSTSRGYLAVASAAALWGVSGVVAKALFNARIEPQTLIEIRLTGAFVVLLAVLLVLRRNLTVARQQIPALALLGAVLATVQFSYYLTISLTDVATAIFLQYLGPVFVVLYAWLLEGEALTAARAVAVAVAILGSYLLVVQAGGLRVGPLGLASGLASAVLFGAYTILTRRRVAQLESWIALLHSFGWAALWWSVLVVRPWEAWGRPYPPEAWLLFAYLAVFSAVLPFGLLYYSLRFISPARASLTSMLEPPVAAAVAWVALGEALGARQITGGAFIVLAVGYLGVSGAREAAEPEVVPAPD